MNLRRAIATLSSTLVVVGTSIAPVLAADGKRDDGDEPGVAMGTTTAILIFVLLPLAFSGLIALFVMAPGWTKGAKNSLQGEYLDDPTRRQIEN